LADRFDTLAWDKPQSYRWTDESHTETLCALAIWRAEIDDTGQDPREELASRPSSPTTPTPSGRKAAA
jgi:hypothetical protein